MDKTILKKKKKKKIPNKEREKQSQISTLHKQTHFNFIYLIFIFYSQKKPTQVHDFLKWLEQLKYRKRREPRRQLLVSSVHRCLQ